MSNAAQSTQKFHKIWLIIGVSVLVLVSGSAGFFISQRSKFPVSDLPVTFEARITSQVQQCGTDGECSITVRGQKIINDCGLGAYICPERVQPKLQVGQKVRVTAIKYDDGHYFHLHCGSCGITVLP